MVRLRLLGLAILCIWLALETDASAVATVDPIESRMGIRVALCDPFGDSLRYVGPVPRRVARCTASWMTRVSVAMYRAPVSVRCPADPHFLARLIRPAP
jgi:hypothetical protein